MRREILAAAIVMVAAGPALAAPAHDHAKTEKAAAATGKMPADCSVLSAADQAAASKGQGPTGRAMTENEAACDAARMANNKHPDLMK